MLTADYYTGGKQGPILRISWLEGGQRTHRAEHPVKGKREARKLAESLGAKPWNF